MLDFPGFFKRPDIPSLEHFLQNYKGGISLEEGLALSRYAANLPGGRIVEVGSYRGKSAVAFAWGLKSNPSPTKKVYCIEPHRPFTGIYGGEFGPADRGDFYEVMLKTGLFHDVALVNLSSEEVAPGWKEQTDLVFIDGDHRYDGVKRDADCWIPKLRVGGYLVFDDATDPKIGPIKVVEELIESKDFEKIETIGKVVFLRKVRQQPGLQFAGFPTKAFSILVACDSMVLTGGLLRFERLGETLGNLGHQLTFVTLSEHPASEFKSQHPVLQIKDAAHRNWDAVMIPGAGFPEAIIERFDLFRQPNYGIRIQHILNDQTRRESFLRVNRSFDPDLVIFNNPHWAPGDYTEFRAKRFHYLFGAVDTRCFFPKPYRESFLQKQAWCIGGLANKNPQPLIEAIKLLPENFSVSLYGKSPSLAESHADLIEAGRLVLSGSLPHKELLSFYHSVDCIVHTEEFAGWANLVAEGMACGIPVICRAPGTKAFAADGENAIMLPDASPGRIAEAVSKLANDPALCEKLALAGRKTMLKYSWEPYAQSLLGLIYDEGFYHYSYCPEVGLHGKWPLEKRLRELTPLLEEAEGAAILDLGAAEGLVAREFLGRGAGVVHGFELDPDRVRIANELIGNGDNVVFRTDDLSRWDHFVERNKDILVQAYDIVLYLGLQHHLPESTRKASLAGAVRMARKFFAVRTSDEVYEKDSIRNEVVSAGFIELQTRQLPKEAGLGRIHIFKKAAQNQKRSIRQRHFISYPKSGRSWLRFLFTGLGIAQHIHFHHDQFEFNDGTLPPHNFDITERLEKYAEQDRIVYLSRDPRDIMVSLYYQVTGRFKDFFHYDGTISDFIRDPYFGAENLCRFRKMWEQISNERDVLTISYEDCHADIESVCWSVLDFYDLPIDRDSLKRAIESASFENMKAVEQSQAFQEPWLRPRNDAPKVRRGKVAGYLDELSREDIDYLSRIFALQQDPANH